MMNHLFKAWLTAYALLILTVCHWEAINSPHYYPGVGAVLLGAIISALLAIATHQPAKDQQ